MSIKILFDRVLSIGINYVGTESQLNGCVNDVINLKNSISTKSHVILSELSHDQNLIPTRANIIRAIAEFVSGVGPNDKLLFQYSGHGSYTRDYNGDESDGRDESICPLDYSKSGDIVDDDLNNLLVKKLPNGCKLWCIFDSCHSGSILDLKYRYTIYPRDNKKKYLTTIDKHYLDSSSDVICISGCRDEQTSADAYINKNYAGAMTWGLLTSIAMLEKDKKPITYRNLMRNLLNLMSDNKYSQIPQISTGKPLDLDSIFF